MLSSSFTRYRRKTWPDARTPTLRFLRDADNEDLDILVNCLTKDKDGELRFTDVCDNMDVSCIETDTVERNKLNLLMKILV